MASKLKLISQLAGETTRQITRDVDGWKRYLTTASRLYKLITTDLYGGAFAYKTACRSRVKMVCFS